MEDYGGPSSAMLVEFIPVRMTYTLFMHSFFLGILLIQMLSVVESELSDLSSSDSATLTALIVLSVILFLFLIKKKFLEKPELVQRVEADSNDGRVSLYSYGCLLISQNLKSL